jgi:hypothetical protein
VYADGKIYWIYTGAAGPIDQNARFNVYLCTLDISDSGADLTAEKHEIADTEDTEEDEDIDDDDRDINEDEETFSAEIYVIGLSPEEARKQLVNAGLIYDGTHYVYIERYPDAAAVPVGTVCGVNTTWYPNDATWREWGTWPVKPVRGVKFSLLVSGGYESSADEPTPAPTVTPTPSQSGEDIWVAVPDVIGLPIAEAERLLTDAGFVVAEVHHNTIEKSPNAASVPVGNVYGTSTSVSLGHPAVKAPRGAKFSLSVNKGHFDPVTATENIRKLYNMTEQEAVEYLHSIGLEAETRYGWGTTGRVSSYGYRFVDEMEIDGISYLDRGSVITLTIGS